MQVKSLNVNLHPTVCNLCGGKVIYTSNKILYGKEYGSGKCYYCTKCGAHVGTHVPRPDEAYGLLSNKTMQMYRKKCHRPFDNLWKGAKNERKMRTCLYGWLAAKMGVDTSDSHFGYFDLEQLREAERILTLVQDKRPVISKKGRLRFEG